MNYYIYNSIYKEILENDKELSANDFLEKYNLSVKELQNLLLQIQKNEYLSSNNNNLIKLINQINNDSELGIYNIIDSKEEIFFEKKKDNVKESKVKKINLSKDKVMYLLTVIFILLGFVIFYSYLKNEDEYKKEKIEESKESNVPENTQAITKTSNEEEEIISINDMESDIKEEYPLIQKKESDIVDLEKKEIVLTDIKQIDNYLNEIKFSENKILFHGKYYAEGEYLLGFKIFKITESNVRFIDEKNNIRKTIIFKN